MLEATRWLGSGDRLMPRCIYCQQDRSEDGFTKIEHAIPQSFGRFQNNFALRNLVCDDCNQYFGNHLELFLGRDSYEGHLRFRHRLNLETAVGSCGDSPWKSGSVRSYKPY